MSIFKKKKQETPPVPNLGGINEIKSEISGNNTQSNSNNVSMSPPPSPVPTPPPSPVPTPSPQHSIPPSQDTMQSLPPTQTNSNFSSPSNSQSSLEKKENQSSQNLAMTSASTNPKTVLDESLFNLEDFELPNLDDLDSQDSKVKSKINQDVSQENSTQAKIKSSNFIPTKGLTSSKEETFFLTTSEFKHLLELIDTVKDRVKVSSQRHMKITTIKAEEDIEYENIKKDFQFIEDKLYEVDSTIFER
ncbi:MAG: hypothetical protein ACMXYB_03685 [Candidatus Woesearchaeota archaeon]